MKHLARKINEHLSPTTSRSVSRMLPSPSPSPPGQPNPPCISTGEIAEAITDNARNNFSKVIGLPYFCGGEERSQYVPNVKCITSAHAWIKDLENRTRTNWTDEGRIEIAKQYALDSAYTHIIHCATKHQNDWEYVKTSFLEIYPEEKSLPTLITELTSVTRRPRETITQLYIRTEGIVEKLENIKPTGKDVYNDMFVAIIMNALPKDFIHIVTDADMKKPLLVYKQALKYIASHPNLQLSDEAVKKENRVIPVNTMTVNAVSQGTTVPRSQAGRGNIMHCQRCGRDNHTIQNCRTIECFRCHKWGHFARQCTVKLPQWTRSPVICFTCGVQGHTNRECTRRSIPGQTQKKTPIYYQRSTMNQ